MMCPYCKGSGYDYSDDRRMYGVRCGDCNGTGFIPDAPTFDEDHKRDAEIEREEQHKE